MNMCHLRYSIPLFSSTPTNGYQMLLSPVFSAEMFMILASCQGLEGKEFTKRRKEGEARRWTCSNTTAQHTHTKARASTSSGAE
jgi:hypothetical protein